jgi:dethiobiotin synthetase
LVRAIATDTVVLVADAALGTINAVRTSVDAFAGLPVVVVLNRYDDKDPVHRANRDWLSRRDSFDIVVGPEPAARRLCP